MTNAALGYGTKLKLGDGEVSETFAEIGEITSLNDEDLTEIKDVSNHQSAGTRREYIGGMIDGGEVTLTCNYDPDGATHGRVTGLRGLVRQTRNFQLEEPGNTEGAQFAAIIMSVSRSYPVDEAMEISITLKKTGDYTYYTVT